MKITHLCQSLLLPFIFFATSCTHNSIPPLKAPSLRALILNESDTSLKNMEPITLGKTTETEDTIKPGPTKAKQLHSTSNSEPLITPELKIS